tara:strand:- start:1238 stop:2866 length:1629 start_codon:yes stop_codon:yes gene_type:complete
MKKINKFLCFLYLTLIFTSCKKTDEIDLSTLQTYHHVAIPLVSAEIDVEDMLERDTGDIISTGTDGELFLAYVTPPTTINASEIIDIPDQTFSISVNPAPQNLPSLINSISYLDTNINAFTFPLGEELSSIEFSQGILTIEILNNLSHEVVLEITIPSLVNAQGNFFSDILTASANNPAVTQANLSNYTFDLTKGSLGFNEMVVYLEVTINGSGSPINTTDELTFSFTMDNLEFSSIFGDIKYQQFDLGSIPLPLDIFSNSESAVQFLLTNPEIKHTIQNSFGFTANMGMQSMYYEDLQGVFLGNVLYDSSASGNLQAAPFYFPAIEQPASQGDSVTSIITMDAANSTINELINSTPKSIISSPVVVVNADSTITNNNFILSSSNISVSTEITLPLEGYAGGWVMGDTIPFDFKVDELFSSQTDIDSAVIKFSTTNGWPIEVDFTLQLLDSNFNLLSSIADGEMVLQSATLDANGRVVQDSQQKVTLLGCDESCVDNLNQTKHVILLVTAGTSDYDNQQSVKIYSDYKLQLSMSLLVSGRMF